MRTTVTLDSDVAAEVARLRRLGRGPSEVINELARRGLSQASEPRSRFTQRTTDLHLKADVTDIGAVLEMLDEPEA